MSDPHVQSFGSFDEMAEYMRLSEEAANEQVTEEQSNIDWGDFWYRLDQSTGIRIYGYIYTLAELEAIEHEFGVNDEEWEDEKAQLIASHKRNYRMSIAYSRVVPDGEMGSVHISQMNLISADEFDAAERRGWYPE